MTTLCKVEKTVEVRSFAGVSDGVGFKVEGSLEVIVEIKLADVDSDDLIAEVERRKIGVSAHEHGRVCDELEGMRIDAGLDGQALCRISECVAAGEIEEALRLLHDLDPQNVSPSYMVRRLVADRAAATAPRLL